MTTALRDLWLSGLVALWLLAVPFMPVSAQDTSVQELISVLEDPQARQELITRLNALSNQDEVAASEDGTLFGIGDLGQKMRDLLATLDDGSDFGVWIVDEVSQEGRRVVWVETGWQVSVALTFGVLAWLVVLRLTTGAQLRLEDDEGGNWLERVTDSAIRFLLGISPIAGFLFANWLATVVLAPSTGTVAVIVSLSAIIGFYATALVLIRVVLSPLRPAIRLVPLSDREAAYSVVWLNRFSAVSIVGFLASDLLSTVGAPEASVDTLLRIVGLILAAMLIVVILQNRQGIARRIGGEEGQHAHFIRKRLADVWHVVAVLAVSITLFVWVFEAERGTAFLLNGLALTTLAALGGALLSILARRGLARLLRIGEDLRERFPDLERRSDRYIFLVGGLINVLIWMIAIVTALEGWGIEAARIFLSPDGLDVLGRLIAVVVVMVIAVLVWELGDGIIAAQLRRSHEGQTNPRMLTLLPLTRNIFLVVIGSIAFLTILGELGLDITPLLAGAGVIGLAIGFGAQSLIKDVITGAFILFENQFTVGDWIEAGGKMGGVENVTVRTIQLRDLDGYVHTIPYGDISAVTNMMRDFGYAVIDIGVAYQENTDRVIDVVRQADEDARNTPSLKERLAGDLEVLGVNDLGDSSVTLRFRIRTLAGYQWGVRREYLRLLKLKFDEVGIEIPYPHMTVYFGEIRGGQTSPALVRLDTEEAKPG